MSTDYLTEDTILPEGQKFICISFLSDSTKKSSLRGIKLRGAFDTIEKASEHAKKLQSIDPAFNVFVGEMGKWLPFDPDPNNSEKVKDSEYANQQLNQMMKAYQENQEKAKMFHEYRKNEKIRQNIQDNLNIKKSNRKKLKKKLKKAGDGEEKENMTKTLA